MGSIDGLDIVSLLLGGAIAYAVSLSVGKKFFGTEVPPMSRALVVVGLGLLVGYSISEVVHALQSMRG